MPSVIHNERPLIAPGERAPSAAAAEPLTPAPRWSLQSGKAVAADHGPQAQAVAPRVSGILQATEPPTFATRWIRRPVLSFGAGVMSFMRGKITEHMQASAAPWVHSMRREDVYLWLSVHQTTLDPVNLLPLRRALPVDIDLRIASRTFKGKLASAISDATIGHFLFHVHRTSMGEGATPEQQEKMRAANAATMASIRAGLSRGIHAAMFPEGTTMTDGRIFEVKKGCLDLIRVPQADGSIQVVPVAPVGFTIDMLAGEGDRYLTFVKVGERIVYEPAAPKRGESQQDYAKRDAQIFVDRVRDTLLRATTITTTQLAGQILMSSLEAKRYDVDKGALTRSVGERALALKSLGYDVDEALLTPAGVSARVDALWTNLVRHGYLDEDRFGVGAINRERALHEALDERFGENDPRRYRRYKHENPLRYCVNRLLQLMATDSRVARVCASGQMSRRE